MAKNSQMNTEFRILGREFDGALDVLAKSFPLRMVNIVIQESVKTHGADNTLIPTDVQLLPVYLQGDHYFSVRAWHETESSPGKVGILQPFFGDFELSVGEVDAYLQRRDAEGAHKLTAAEALGLISLSNIAASHDATASFVDQEALE